MKKTFKTLFIAALGLMALASCEDVPAPYATPGDSSEGGDNTEVKADSIGDGSLASPYNVAGVKAFIDGSSYDASKLVYIKGIVTEFKSGEEPGNSYGNSTFYIADEKGGSNTFYCYRVKSFNNEKFTTADANLFTVGDTVVVCGNVVLYSGTSGSTYETTQNTAYLVSVNGKNAEGEDTGGDSTIEAKGDGTAANPYNVAGVNAYLDGTYDETKEIYFTGIVKKFKSGEEPGNSYGNATFYIQDSADASDDFYCYRIYGFDGEKFTSASQLQVGDIVVVKSLLTIYTSTYGSTKETQSGKGQLVSINGKKEYSTGNTDDNDDDEGDETSTTGESMTISNLPSDITANGYGSQAVATESTWLTWTWNNVQFAGCKVCKALETNGAGIQMQGNASDAAKQGFIFNKTAWATNINKITIVLKVVTTSTNDPSYSLYAGTEAHPTSGAIEATSTKKTVDGFNVYTQTFDLSGKGAKFFTIANDKVGALYIDSITIE